MCVALASRLTLCVILAVGIPLAPAIACDDGHWIEETLADGKVLKLEDGSLWRVDSIDTVTSALWVPMSDVIVDLAPKFYPVLSSPWLLDLPGWAAATGAGAEPSA